LLTRQNAVLCPQVDPLKLAADWIGGAVGLVLFWYGKAHARLHRRSAAGGRASIFVVYFRDLEWLRRTSLGRDAVRYIGSWSLMARSVGYAVAAVAAYFHRGEVVVIGITLIALGWSGGLLGRLSARFGSTA
jgi:hypothetical protein